MNRPSDQTSRRIESRLKIDGEQVPSFCEILRVVLTEMLPLQSDTRATSRMSATLALQTLHDKELWDQGHTGMRNAPGHGRTSTRSSHQM